MNDITLKGHKTQKHQKIIKKKQQLLFHGISFQQGKAVF